MADINTTILIKAQDEASNVIKKVAKTTTEIGDAAKTSIGGVTALGNAIKSSLAPLIAIGAAVEGLRKSLALASDLQEAASKASVVFRNNTNELANSIKTLTTSYGMSAIEATKAMGALGDLFKPLGFAEKDALKLSETTVRLARDLASFNNLNTDDVLRDIQSALVGNVEAVRKYGVVLNETTIAQAAVNAGLDPKNLTPAQKSWLILNEIIRSNKDALGDYQRTQDSFANTLRRLQTIATEIATAFGGELLNALSSLFSGLANVAEFALPAIIAGIRGLGSVLSFVLSLLRSLLDVVNLVATLFIRTFGDVILKILSLVAKTIATVFQTLANGWNKLSEALARFGITLPKIDANFNEMANNAIDSLDGIIKKVREGKTVLEALGLTAKKTGEAMSLPEITVSAPRGGAQSIAGGEKQTKGAPAVVSAAGGDVFTSILLSFAEKFVNAMKNFSRVFEFLSNILDNVANILAQRLAIVIDVFMPFIILLERFLIILAEQIANLIEAVRPLLEALFGNIMQVLAIFLIQIASLLQLFVPALQFVAQILKPILEVTSFILRLIYDVIVAIYNNVFVPIVNVFVKAFNAIGGFFSSAINFVIDIINWIIDAVNKIPGVRIGRINRVGWSNISEVSPITVPSSTTALGGSAGGSATSTTSGGLSVQSERPIIIYFTNNGVLAGFKNEDDFIAWLRKGLTLASARGG